VSTTFKLPPGVNLIPGAMTSGGAHNPKTCEGKFDKFGLTACQIYNIGNQSNWFFSFRMGIQGVAERLQILRTHSACLHDWLGNRNRIFVNHHVVVMLFCMDSAIECFTFMLNAMGQAVDRNSFRDIATDKGLRKISPRDVIGGSTSDPLTGYATYFPSLQSYWRENSDLIELIMANHDVSKHRHSPPASMQLRQDPPDGYFEAMGLAGGDLRHTIARAGLTPMKEVSLSKKPRLPMSDPDRKDWTSLEQIEKDFAPFIPKSFCLALEDARANIVLADPTLHP
jgi:hypothetical protein